MFTLVMKSNGCPNCHMVKNWLDAANVKEGTYKILLADDGTSDWMSFCKQHNVNSVPHWLIWIPTKLLSALVQLSIF